ncbi:MAG: transcription termination/antitermination protein NusG [Oscillospiraceae bacterium]|nr:transcription termination/antitermination protein NusG [Oscillospiraceae bacterium]
MSNLNEVIREEAKWYVIHTYSGYEKNVETNIKKIVENRKMEHLIQDLRIPLEKLDEAEKTEKPEEPEQAEQTEQAEEPEKSAVKTRAKKDKHDRKLLPSYVLVKMVMCDESWHVVRNTRGVTAFVGPGSKPIALTEEEIQRLEIEAFVPMVDFEVGDSVKITEGALKNSIGIVEEISTDKKKIKLTVSMFGRQTIIEMDTSAVEKID